METRTRGAFKAWKGPLAATLILVMLITAASFWVTGRINQEEEQTSFSRLEGYSSPPIETAAAA